MGSARIALEETRKMGITVQGSAVVWAPKQRATEAARAILERAHRKADQIVAAAEEQARELRRRAARQGYRAGHQKAAGALAAAARCRARARSAVWPNLVQLASHMARRIVRTQLHLRPEALGDMCREVAQEVPLGSDLVIRVHPEDLDRLERCRPELSQALSARVHVVPAAEVESGGFLIEGEAGRIDARLEVQLEQLAAAVVGETNVGRV